MGLFVGSYERPRARPGGVGELGQDVGVAQFGGAPAGRRPATQLGYEVEKFGAFEEVRPVLVHDLGAGAVCYFLAVAGRNGL